VIIIITQGHCFSSTSHRYHRMPLSHAAAVRHRSPPPPHAASARRYRMSLQSAATARHYRMLLLHTATTHRCSLPPLQFSATAAAVSDTAAVLLRCILSPTLQCAAVTARSCSLPLPQSAATACCCSPPPPPHAAAVLRRHRTPLESAAAVVRRRCISPPHTTARRNSPPPPHTAIARSRRRCLHYCHCSRRCRYQRQHRCRCRRGFHCCLPLAPPLTPLHPPPLVANAAS
jgi:hypothetical protein